MKKLFNVRNIPIIAALFVILLSIAYSAFGTNLNIGGIAADVRIEADIRVTGISVDSYTNSAISSYEEYNVSNISMGANLPNSNSTITYKVDVTNFGNVEMGIFAINNLPSNLEYELSGYTLQDKLCNNNQCSLGIKKEFYITIKYKDGGYNASNTTYALNLDFDFRSFYTVTYEDFSSTISYPKEIISGGDLALNFTELVPDIEVKVGNLILDQDSYTFDQYNLYVSNVTNNVVVKYISYPPTIVFNLVDSSVINSNGWAKENFYLQATVTDNSSKGIKSASSCTSSNGTACTPNASFTDTTKSFYITTEGNNMACVTVTDNNDRTTTACSDVYNLDKTAPTAGTATFTGTQGSNSWYTTNVGVNVVNGSDSLSGHSSTVSNVTSITSNTTGTTVRITTTDLAGNTASRDYTIKVDKNSPTISAKYDSVDAYYGDSNVVSNYFNIGYSTSSGSVSCTPTNTSQFTTGDAYETFTATCTVTGGNGKTASASISVRVIVKNLYAFFMANSVYDNTSSTYVSSSTGINFSSAASSTNGLGYYYSPTHGVYYARGSVTNNNVLFANACWKMVRTDGSGVKLIYNGTSSIANPNGICGNTGTSSQIGTSAFNSVQTDNAYVGYMYGAPETSTIYGDVNGDGSVTQTDYLLIQRYVNGTTTPTEEQKILADVNLDGSLTDEDSAIVKNYVLGSITSIIDQNTDTARYNATHKNRTNSTIKSTIDSWYASNMTSYTSKLKDAIWCNDRSKSSSYLGYGNWSTYYAAYNRSSSPSLTCTNANDRFTVSTSNGNGALTYPVGLLTYDEWILAGRTVGYLNSGSTWWTMTPRNYQASVSGSTTYNYTSSSSSSVTTSYGVRPSIVLSSTSFTSGTGTVGDPFVVS